MISPSGHPTLLTLPTSWQLLIGADPCGAGLGRKGRVEVLGTGSWLNPAQGIKGTGHRPILGCTGSAACRASAALEAAS